MSNIWLTIKIWKKRKIESQKKLLKSTLEKLIIVLQRKFDCFIVPKGERNVMKITA